MSFSIDYITFKKRGVNYLGRDIGTIIVTFGQKVVEALAVRYATGDITVAGFVGRYRTSTKAWNVNIRLTEDSCISLWWGRDERTGRFNKNEGVSWEP